MLPTEVRGYHKFQYARDQLIAIWVLSLAIVIYRSIGCVYNLILKEPKKNTSNDSVTTKSSNFKHPKIRKPKRPWWPNGHCFCQQCGKPNLGKPWKAGRQPESWCLFVYNDQGGFEWMV